MSDKQFTLEDTASMHHGYFEIAKSNYNGIFYHQKGNSKLKDALEGILSKGEGFEPYMEAINKNKETILKYQLLSGICVCDPSGKNEKYRKHLS